MFTDLLSRHSKILAECAVTERLRRTPGVTLHPTLFLTPLIYDTGQARAALEEIYEGYMQAATTAGLPLILTAPTWRIDANRIAAANVPPSINSDAVAFLTRLRDRFCESHSAEIIVGALTGPMNDCYRADLSPDADVAERFHTPQIDELASTKAAFLLAQTLPSVREAVGVARAMASTGKPYCISFCTGPDGHILDGTPLSEAMALLDQDNSISRPPEGYFVNCSHPQFLLNTYAPGSLRRLIGIQANASSKDVTKLEGASETVADPIDDWAASMLELHLAHDVPVLGGCCGTTLSHLQRLA